MQKRFGKQIIKLIAILMCLIGLIGFLMGLTCECLSAVGITLTSSHIRLPHSNLSGFDVDREGNIYCYAGTYHRLQIFDNTGLFLRGWFVKAARVGEIHVDESGHIHFVDTSDKQLVFDTEWTQDRVEENKFINQVRARVALWREGGYVHAKNTIRAFLAGKETP